MASPRRTPTRVRLVDLDKKRPDALHRLRRSDQETPNTKGNRSLETMLDVPAAKCVTLYDSADAACTAQAADTLGNPRLVKDDDSYEVQGQVMTLYYKIDGAQLMAAREQQAMAAASAAGGPAFLSITPPASAAGAAAASGFAVGGTTPASAADAAAAAPGSTAGGSSSGSRASKAAAGRKRATSGLPKLAMPVKKELQRRVALTMRRGKSGKYAGIRDKAFWHDGYAAVKKTLLTWAIQEGHTPVSEEALHKHAIKEMNNVNVGIKGVLAGKKSCTYTPKWMKRKQKEAKAWGKAYGADCMANRLPDNDPYFGTAKQAPQQTPATEAPPPPPALPQQLLPGSLPLPALPKQLSWPQQQQPALDPVAALANAACAADDVATDVRHLLDSLGKTKQAKRPGQGYDMRDELELANVTIKRRKAAAAGQGEPPAEAQQTRSGRVSKKTERAAAAAAAAASGSRQRGKKPAAAATAAAAAAAGAASEEEAAAEPAEDAAGQMVSEDDCNTDSDFDCNFSEDDEDEDDSNSQTDSESQE